METQHMTKKKLMRQTRMIAIVGVILVLAWNRLSPGGGGGGISICAMAHGGREEEGMVGFKRESDCGVCLTEESGVGMEGTINESLCMSVLRGCHVWKWCYVGDREGIIWRGLFVSKD